MKQRLKWSAWCSCLSALAVAALVTSTALADVSARRVMEATSALPDRGARFFSELSSGSQLQLLARVESRARAVELGFSPKTDHFAVVTARQEELDSLSRLPGVERLFWSPARRLQLDQVVDHVRLPEAVEQYGVDGAGVTVGIIDTGIDVAHPAVRNPDGTTRIRWLLSYGEPPLGIHLELEDEYGCTQEAPCAVYSAAEIDAALESGEIEGFFPDDIGHGTHITSIAAGSDPNRRGMAPGADLVVVQAAGETGSVSDARIVAGASFIFDRASEMMRPAVVNVSLGSSFGAHDGSSAIEMALSELARGPGRAVVVASGNDGGLFAGLSEDYPEPIGSHTLVHVPKDSEVRVPLLTPPTGGRDITGSIFVWIATDPEERVSLAFHNGRGEGAGPVRPGEAGGVVARQLGDPDDYEFVIFNGVDEELQAGVGPGSIVFALDGTWESGRVFELVLTGQGPAKMWVEGAGGVSDAATGIGVVFPRARASGTVTVPASAPSLISVGASVNRNAWVDFTGTEVELELGTVGSRAYFSGAGPSRTGHLKPDLLAPGGNVVAAMSRASDPREGDGARSQFASGGLCGGVECFVADDDQGVASGTSMATPVVSGAVALLFQRDPELTMEQIRRLLRAGAAEAEGEGANRGLSGAGILDVAASLRALDAETDGGERLPSARHSRLVFADGFVRPSAPYPLRGLAILRDQMDWPATGFDGRLLEAEVVGPGSVDVDVVGAGLAELKLRAEEGAGLSSVTVRLSFDGELLDEMTLPVDVDSHTTNYGPALAGGSCAVRGLGVSSNTPWLWLLLAMAGFIIVRRPRSLAR